MTPRLFWVALLIASAALRIPGLLESLWHDEIFRTRVMLRPGTIGDLLLNDVHNPLYNALMYAWVRVFGDSEVSIRLPSLLAGYALTWVAWRWVRERFGGRVGAFVAAWLLLSPVPVWYSVEAKNSIFSAFFAVLVMVTHDRLATDALDGKPLRSRLAACIAAAALGVLTDFQVLLALVPVWFAVAMRSRRAARNGEPAGRRLGVMLLVVIAAAAALLFPLILHKSAHVSELARGYLRLFALQNFLWFIFVWLPVGAVLPPPPRNMWPLWVASTAVVLAPLLWMGLRSLSRSASGRQVNAAFVWPLVFYAVASAALQLLGDRTRIYQDRNIIVLLAWYPLVIAAGIETLRSRRVRQSLAVLTLGAGLVSSVLIVTVVRERRTVSDPNPDWQSATRLLEEHAGPELVVSRSSLLALRYYSPDTELLEFRKGPAAAGEIARVLAGRRETEFVLISSTLWEGLRPDEMPEIDRRFPLVSRTELLNMTLERRRR